MLLLVVPLFATPPPRYAQRPAGCDRSVWHILNGNYDAALRELAGAPTNGMSDAEAENMRGLALLLDGDTTKALASFNRALELKPELLPARYNRGLTFLRIRDYAKAAADLEKVYADEHSAFRADAAYHLGITYDRLGRLADAEASLERALKLDAALDAALLYVGTLRERRGDLQGAGRAYFDYLSAHPQSVNAMFRFGVAAHKAGRVDVAKTYLQKVIAAAPRSAEAVEARKFLVMWE